MEENLNRDAEIVAQIEDIKVRLRVLDRAISNSGDVRMEQRSLNARWQRLKQEYSTLENCGNY